MKTLKALEKLLPPSSFLLPPSSSPAAFNHVVSAAYKSRCKSSGPPCPDHVLENVLENVLQFLTSRRDRNAVSLVCRSWYLVEAQTRFEVFIGNCYSLSPARLTHRFKLVRSLVLKGKTSFADLDLMPPDWGAQFAPWVAATAKAYPWLEKLNLKRMFVTDDDLALLAESFPGFKELILLLCERFGTSGIAVVANKCSDMALRYILEGCLKLQKLEIGHSPFGDVGLRSGICIGIHNRRFVWMSSCSLSRGGCRDIAHALPSVVVEVFGSDDDVDDNADYVETLYMYRSLDGPRKDAPKFVPIL